MPACLAERGRLNELLLALKTLATLLWQSKCRITRAAIAQLGERQTEDLKVPGSIPGLGILLCSIISSYVTGAS